MSSTAPTSSRIALTPGEPAGIGPDLALMLAREARPEAVVHFADPELMSQRAAALGMEMSIVELDSPATAVPQPAGCLQVYPVRLARPAAPGVLDVANADYVLQCLDHAIDACASGQLHALVTGPVQKSVIIDAGHAFSGHTEYLARRLGAPLPVMMLAAGRLRVVVLTTHVALEAVPPLVSAERVTAVGAIVHEALIGRFGIPAPRIAVCGLNPHAGEQGHLGRQEIEQIAPGIARLAARGIEVEGPLAADTAFTPACRGRYDAIIAMYHDQGLGPLKAVSFGDAVNVTLGLPIVRTSVDHGTALDLAGTGRADGASLRAALSLAAELAHASQSPA